MKKTMKMLAAVAFVAIVAFALVGCGGPDALAKQTVDLTKQMEKAISDGDQAKIANLTKKGLELTAKVEKLSKEDQQKYMDKVTELMK